MVSLRKLMEQIATGDYLPRRSERIRELNEKNKGKQVNYKDPLNFSDESGSSSRQVRGKRKGRKNKEKQVDDEADISFHSDKASKRRKPMDLDFCRPEDVKDCMERRWTYLFHSNSGSIPQMAMHNPSELVQATKEYSYEESLMRFAKSCGPAVEEYAKKYYEQNLHNTTQKLKEKQEYQ